MRPSSLGGGRILRRTLSVRLSVRPSVPLAEVVLLLFTFAPSYERTSKIEQEAQLMLTTGTTRLAVSRGQQTW